MKNTEESTLKQGNTTRELCYMALFSAMIAICAWISIPSAVPFTLQTFAVFFALILLGGKLGTGAVVVYLSLGAVGVPVFAGFSGGVGALLGMTGGYLLGFLLMTCFYWGVEKFIQKSKLLQILCLLVGLALTYTFGTLWFVQVYITNVGEMGFFSALGMCVIPYVIPDLTKMALAFALAQRIKPILSRR